MHLPPIKLVSESLILAADLQKEIVKYFANKNISIFCFNCNFCQAFNQRMIFDKVNIISPCHFKLFFIKKTYFS